MAKSDAGNEITRDTLFVATRRIPRLSASDIHAALTAAGVPLEVERICELRSDVTDEAGVIEALRNHVEQCFLVYFMGALHRLYSRQIQPSVLVRHLRGLPNARSIKPYTEITRWVLRREALRVLALSPVHGNDPFRQIVQAATAYEGRKAVTGSGGKQHEGNVTLSRLYTDLMDAYRQFTGFSASAHVNTAGSYDGPYVRFVASLFASMATKSRKSNNVLIQRVGGLLHDQTVEKIRDRWIASRKADDRR